MSNQIVVKYFQESEFVKEPCQATEVSAGYDLYVAEPEQFCQILLIVFHLGNS